MRTPDDYQPVGEGLQQVDIDSWRSPTYTACPACGYTADAYSSTRFGEHVDRPEPGDSTCCFRCQAVARFVRSPLGVLSLRPATEDEIAEFDELAPGVRANAAAYWRAHPSERGAG